MGENFVKSMAKQIEAQIHESKLWRASQPLSSQSSMQERESKKKSSNQQFRIACEMPKGVQAVGQRAGLKKLNFASLVKPNAEQPSQK